MGEDLLLAARLAPFGGWSSGGQRHQRPEGGSRYHRLRVARERARDELILPRARRGAPFCVGGLASCQMVVLGI